MGSGELAQCLLGGGHHFVLPPVGPRKPRVLNHDRGDTAGALLRTGTLPFPTRPRARKRTKKNTSLKPILRPQASGGAIAPPIEAGRPIPFDALFDDATRRPVIGRPLSAPRRKSTTHRGSLPRPPERWLRSDMRMSRLTLARADPRNGRSHRQHSQFFLAMIRRPFCVGGDHNALSKRSSKPPGRWRARSPENNRRLRQNGYRRGPIRV